MTSCTMLSFLASSCAHLKSPFRGFYFTSENAFVFFSISTFQGDKAPHHHSGRATSVIAAFYLLKVLFGWRFQLPLTLYSCLLFFCRLLSKPLYSLSFFGTNIPTFLACIVLFPSFFQSLPRCAFAPRTVSTANLSVCFSFCLLRIVVTFLA